MWYRKEIRLWQILRKNSISSIGIRMNSINGLEVGKMSFSAAWRSSNKLSLIHSWKIRQDFGKVWSASKNNSTASRTRWASKDKDAISCTANWANCNLSYQDNGWEVRNSWTVSNSALRTTTWRSRWTESGEKQSSCNHNSESFERYYTSNNSIASTPTLSSRESRRCSPSDSNKIAINQQSQATTPKIYQASGISSQKNEPNVNNCHYKFR